MKRTGVVLALLAVLTLTGCAAPSPGDTPSAIPPATQGASSPEPSPTLALPEPTTDPQIAFIEGFKMLNAVAASAATDEQILAVGNIVCAKIADPENTTIQMDLDAPETVPLVDLAKSTLCP